jgi:hypothetical protein
VTPCVRLPSNERANNLKRAAAPQPFQEKCGCGQQWKKFSSKMVARWACELAQARVGGQV